MRALLILQGFGLTFVAIVGAVLIIFSIKTLKSKKKDGNLVIYFIVGALALFGAFCATGVVAKTFEALNVTKVAEQFEEAGDYYNAYWCYIQASEMAPNADIRADIERTFHPGMYETASRYAEEGDYYGAYNAYAQLGNYFDSVERSEWCMFMYLQREHPDWFN